MRTTQNASFHPADDRIQWLNDSSGLASSVRLMNDKDRDDLH